MLGYVTWCVHVCASSDHLIITLVLCFFVCAAKQGVNYLFDRRSCSEYVFVHVLPVLLAKFRSALYLLNVKYDERLSNYQAISWFRT